MHMGLTQNADVSALQEQTWTSTDPTEYAFVCNCMINGAYNTEVFNQDLTEVNLDTNTVTCYARQACESATVTFKINRASGVNVGEVADGDIIIVRPKGKSSDDDDYEYMSNFNPLYLSIILVVAGGLLVGGLHIRDSIYKAKDERTVSDLASEREKKPSVDSGDPMMKPGTDRGDDCNIV